MEVVVATSYENQDLKIFEWCNRFGVKCFRGSEKDVLGRYFSCAQEYSFESVVRLTADNPFTDIEELELLIDLHISSANDYTNSFKNLPIGVGAEIFSYDALVQSNIWGYKQHHREHVNEYIIENPGLFRTGQLEIPASKCAPNLRLTVDTYEDWLLACRLAERAKSTWLTTEEGIALCSQSV